MIVSFVFPFCFSSNMSQQGAALQSYNNELVKCIEELCSKRDELHRQILEEEEEKRKIQNDLRILTERLSKVNESLSKKTASRNEFDKTIAETEAAYMKILESSQTLLNVLKKETHTLGTTNANTPGGASVRPPHSHAPHMVHPPASAPRTVAPST